VSDADGVLMGRPELERASPHWESALSGVVLSRTYSPSAEPCACRRLRPCSSSSMLVLVDDPAEPVAAADV
jgi:hypothetical protein